MSEDEGLDPHAERVPYAFGYGVDNLRVQRALEGAAAAVLDELELGIHELLDREDPLRGYRPCRHAAARVAPLYDHRFFARFKVCLTIVGWKLAQPECLPMTCLGEELAFHAISQNAWIRLDTEGPAPPAEEFATLREFALQDTDYRVLFEMDHPVETELVDLRGVLGVGDLSFNESLRPFGDGTSYGVPHPLLWRCQLGA